MSLVYLLASLPGPALDAPLPLAPAAFVRACREQVGASLADAAAALIEDRPHPHPFVAAWREREALLRNAVARRRAARRQTDPAPWLRPTEGCDPRLERAVEAAYQQPDPLARERALDRLRWTLADELQGFDPMSAQALLAYAVRLRLVARWSLLRGDTGRGRAAALSDVPFEISSRHG